MDIVTIDGMVEHDFRLSVEDMLRLDQVDEAVERLRGLLETCVVRSQGDGGILPPRFLQVTADYIEIGGWNRLADRLRDHDRARHPISAIGVTLADYRALGGPGIRAGRLAPFVKTFYFNDDGYPFSEATRADLLDGYSRDGFEWQGDYQATDATLSVRGIDDLYGAIVELEERLLASPDPGDAEIRAGTIGACYVSVLIHQALRDTIRRKGLPRPLCVFAGCDGVYPFFDAPVIGSDQYRPDPVADAEEAGEPAFAAGDDGDEGDDLPGEASLLTMLARPRTKAPVMVLCEQDAEEAARYSEMAAAQRLGMEHGHAPNDALALPDDGQLSEAALFDADALLQHDEPEVAIVPSADLNWRPSPLDALESPAELAAEPVMAPASHSLRTRIKLAEPDATDTFGDRLKAMLGALRRMLSGN